jgi:hypothetical protein
MSRLRWSPGGLHLRDAQRAGLGRCLGIARGRQFLITDTIPRRLLVWAGFALEMATGICHGMVEWVTGRILPKVQKVQVESEAAGEEKIQVV